MGVIFQSLGRTIIAGVVLVVILLAAAGTFGRMGEHGYWLFFMRWLHIGSGVMWIGILWYFNFVQTPTMPKIPDELKGGVSRFIAPAALFWFRWAAMSTIIWGVILAAMYGYLLEAYTLDLSEGLIDLKAILIGIGMWFGTIMWFNVWFVIWPNQQKALNIGNAYPDLPADQKQQAARTAGMASRINTMLSIPMLFCMVAGPHLA